MSIAQTYAGLRVLDLSTNLAGPLAAMVLGDLGADVVKVERPPTGDDTRLLPPRHGDQATVFIAVNRNKRSLLLDFKAAPGRDALLRLVAKADVVIESFPPGVAQKLRLTFDDLRAANPRLIVCSISAFGDGPLGSQRPGYDALVQAMSGMMSFTGHPDTPPIRLAPSVLDLSTGLWAAIAVQAALARRSQGGAAEHLRPSLIDSAFALMCHQVLGYLATGALPEKLGSGAPSAAPYRVFDAADGAFMLATATDAQFVRLCKVVGNEALATDPRFATMDARLAARTELDRILQQAFAMKPALHWLQELSAAGLSVSPVNDLAQALDSPLTVERELLVPPEKVRWAGGMPQLRIPIDPEGAGVRRPPPRLGEHSAEVLREAGLDEAAIAALLRDTQRA